MAVMEISTEFEAHLNGPTHTLGPCPGCWSWQLDYDVDSLLEQMTLAAFYELLEGALREHYDECAHLRLEFPDL